MNKKQILVVAAILINLLSNSSSADVVYSNQTIGGTNIINTGSTTMISGPNGMMILNNSTDQFSGSWSSGMNVTLSRVLSGEHLPSKIVINNLEVKMNDGEEMAVLALTAEEQKAPQSEKSQILWGRAAQVCQLTKSHTYALNVETKIKWFKGLLLDLNQEKTKSGVYSTYKATSLFSGARYFSEITCGIKPRGY